MNNLFLGLGTNLGDKKKNIILALKYIEKESDTYSIGEITKKSSIYKTKAQGFESEHDFLNMAIEVQTNYLPFEILEKIELIEKKIGRDHKSMNKSYEDRIIDIDILYFNDLIIQEEKLSIPHPEIKNRKFVLEPLCEIAPNLIDPIEKKSIQMLLSEL